ncbi:MAG TPA: hypothetical protein VJM33_07845, partial [Microthrixaceae bacterium]|nr:hypothetical protein [Microthrixaceae bacterium]
MRRGVLVVESRPASAERAAEYHHWYDDVHLPDVLAVPGFVSARRFRVCDRATGVPDPDELGHVTIYELEAD